MPPVCAVRHRPTSAAGQLADFVRLVVKRETAYPREGFKPLTEQESAE